MIRLATLVFIIAALVSVAPASAQLVDLSWNTIDGGGGQSSGGAFVLIGTIGQPDATSMTGGVYALGGGFWGGATPVSDCPADIINSGGSANNVDIDDLLAVISGWGPCPVPPAACPANIATGGGSATVVNIDDLLAVISAWGPCP